LSAKRPGREENETGQLSTVVADRCNAANYKRKELTDQKLVRKKQRSERKAGEARVTRRKGMRKKLASQKRKKGKA